MQGLDIRKSVPSDWPSIEALYQAAFPDEDFLPVVRELLLESSVAFSLAGNVDPSLAAHAIFTPCAVTGRGDKVSLLGPLAVASPWQRQGVGRALVCAGLELLDRSGVTCAYVLGDPAYYGRLGFLHEADVDPPYALPAEWRFAWQSMSLGTVGARCRGTLSVPPAWLKPALWTP